MFSLLFPFISKIARNTEGGNEADISRTVQSRICWFGTQSKNEVGERTVIKHYGQDIYESSFELYERCLND